MYSSYPGLDDVAALKLAFRPSVRYSGVGLMLHPVSQPIGHALKWRQTLVPVSNATTGEMFGLGAPYFK